MIYFSVKNYEHFQHYKDRSPPWIKFYNAVLDDYGYTSLPDASRSHLVAIWLLASRTNNRIPHDAEWVRMAIKASSPVDLDALANAGFIVVEHACSKMLAERKQDAIPERETETETETEKKESRQGPRAEVLAPEAPPDPRKAIFDDGLRWLATATKRPERALRPLVGKWIKARGDPEVAAAMIAAQQAAPVDPISWIEARLKSNGQKRPSELERRRHQAAAFLDFDIEGGAGPGGADRNPPDAGEAFAGLPRESG